MQVLTVPTGGTIKAEEFLEGSLAKPRVLLAVSDFSTHSYRALRRAAALSRQWGARLVLLHVVQRGVPAARGSLEDVVGVIKKRRVLNELLNGRAPDLAACVEQVPHVSEHMTALEVIEALRNSPARMVLVFDEYGQLEGIVTEGDILRAIAGGFVEATGEEPTAVPRPDGSWLIDGTMSVEEANERLNFLLPSNRAYHTLAGFILHELQHVPEVGDLLDYDGWRFEIMDMDGRRIDKVLASRVSPPPRRLATI